MKKVFILGDSRTGTLSLSNYLNALGIPTIHYYEKEAKQLPHHNENKIENFRRIVQFIEKSGATGFSDYPTRLYYEELVSKYPDAHFILTTRSTLDVWRTSMLEFFGKFNVAIDIDELEKVHVELNNNIRNFFGSRKDLKFLEICIDNGSEMNSAEVKRFLNIDSDLSIGWDNRTIDINNDLLSGRIRVLNFEPIDVVRSIESARRSAKGVLSEYGWVYLINDSNQYLHYLYGEKWWTAAQHARATNVLEERVSQLSLMGTQYLKIIVPEKPVIYNEFLPKLLANIKQSDSRPSKQIAKACPGFVEYIADYLRDAKSYGLLCFRGDSHLNWLGAYMVYRYTMTKVQGSLGDRIQSPISLGKLVPSIYGYDGDIVTQLSEQDKGFLDDQWQDMQFNGAFEFGVRYELPLEHRKAYPVSISGELSAMKFSRELIIREVDDPGLPTAVIFRDSTADLMIDLLAEHFRRTVFVWHRGEVLKRILELEKPDMVIHFMAERFVTSYGIDMVALAEFLPE